MEIDERTSSIEPAGVMAMACTHRRPQATREPTLYSCGKGDLIQSLPKLPEPIRKNYQLRVGTSGLVSDEGRGLPHRLGRTGWKPYSER
jgi:hypothetical protein